MNKYQRTIEKEMEIKGIGLHSGKNVNLKLIPAEANTGIIFIRNGVSIPAYVDYANGFDFSTSLYKDGQWVKTIEHLMAALFFLDIDNLFIEIDNEEVPILDGSAKVFMEKIKEVGIREFKEEKLFAVLTKEIKTTYEDRFIVGKPSPYFKATYHANYNNSIIGNKKATYIHKDALTSEIPDARTYCFLEEVDFLRRKGLAQGGSLKNAVVIHEDNVINPEGFRFKDEPVKHKVLDLIGDLYLIGHSLVGDFYSFKGGHKLNAAFVKDLILQEAIDIVPASELHKETLKA